MGILWWGCGWDVIGWDVDGDGDRDGDGFVGWWLFFFVVSGGCCGRGEYRNFLWSTYFIFYFICVDFSTPLWEGLARCYSIQMLSIVLLTPLTPFNNGMSSSKQKSDWRRRTENDLRKDKKTFTTQSRISDFPLWVSFTPYTRWRSEMRNSVGGLSFMCFLYPPIHLTVLNCEISYRGFPLWLSHTPIYPLEDWSAETRIPIFPLFFWHRHVQQQFFSLFSFKMRN